MFCVAALVVFSILGIFSATHREYARRALDCVFRRVTLRPCNTGFSEQVRSQILARLLGRSVWAAKMFNKYFEVFAWIFMIAMVASTIWTAQGIYRYYLYGSCNGLNASGFCAFDPSGTNNKVSSMQDSETCSLVNSTESDLTLAGLDLSLFPRQNESAKDKLVMIACYECDYSRAVYPDIAKLVAKYNLDFTFIHFPVKAGESETFMSAFGNCVYQASPEKFWTWNEQMFAASKSDLDKPEFVATLASDLGLDGQALLSCALDQATLDQVRSQYSEAKTTKFYGTPTIFINGQAAVGPKPYRVYRAMVNKYLFF